MIVTSMDVIGLYPNLDINRSAEECGKEMEETQVKYKNVDMLWAGKFVASNMSQSKIDKEGLRNLIPRRKKRCGVRPGSTTKELYERKKYDENGDEKENESKWVILKTEYNEKEKRRVLMKVVELGIKILMRNHVYQFEGKNQDSKRRREHRTCCYGDYCPDKNDEMV